MISRSMSVFRISTSSVLRIRPFLPTVSCRRSIMTDSDVFPPPALKKAAEDVAFLLKERKETISVAETAAGGLISAALLSTAGASKIYKASHLTVGRH